MSAIAEEVSSSTDEGTYLYAIHCLDDLSCGMVDKGQRFGGSVKRMSVYAEHKVVDFFRFS